MEPGRRPREYAAVRAMIIGYGVAALSYLQVQLGGAEAPRALGGFASSQSLLLVGLGLQALLIAARALIQRYAPDEETMQKAMPIVGLAADAVTVFLYALGTLGAMASAGREL